MRYQVIDAHNHPDWYGYSADKFVAEMDRWGIDRCWLLTWDTPENEVDPAQFNLLNEGPYRTGEGPIPLWRCLAFKEKYPDRFIVGYAPDPRRPDAIDNLEAAIALYDIQVCGEIKVRMIYDNPDAVEYFRFCGEKKLPVTLHFENPISTGRKYPRRSYWYGGDMDTLDRLRQKCPDPKFLGHAVVFWSTISGDSKGENVYYPDGPVLPGGRIPQLLRRYPNLYCDISARSGRNALQRDPSFAKEFLDEFQDRVVFARDCFGNEHKEFLESLNLSQTVYQKIFAQNACSLLRKEGTP